MLKRDKRLVTFLADDEEQRSGRDLRTAMRHFLEATPENDLVEIFDGLTGQELYASPGATQWLKGVSRSCTEPCLSTASWRNHHFRVLTHTATLHGRSLRLVLAGSIDEHYDILRVVGEGFAGLLPFVLLGAACGGYYLSRRALLPVGRMTTQAQQLELADLRARIDVPQTRDELQELALAWNGMLARLEASAERIAQFSSDASHDLRTAITILLSNAELTLRQTRSTERYEEVLRTVLRESLRMLEMIDNLLLTAQPGRDGGPYDVERVDLCQLLAETSQAHQAAATMRSQTLFFETEPSRQALVLADRSLLMRLINILVENAIKYTPQGGQVLLHLFVQDEQAVLDVIDTGVGIPTEMHEKVFERLVRVSSERTQEAERGYGLGLSIARWIAEHHGFLLSLNSAPGSGSTFRLSMHLAH